MMHRIFALLLWMLWEISSIASQDSMLHFTEEPSSAIAKLGDRIVLRCSTNIPVNKITWHFNDVILTSESDSNRERRKRNREDRDPSVVHSQVGHVGGQSSENSESWRNTVQRFSNPKKVRRRKERNRKERRRNDEPEIGHRYVRSDERGRSVNAKTYDVQLRGGRLIIQSFDENNAGLYYCVASTSNGSIRSVDAKVQMAYISNFTATPPESVTATSMAFVLPCELPDSLPTAQARWQVNGGSWIEGSTDPYMVLPSGNLLIKDVDAVNGSSFRCAAYNSVTDQTVTSPGSTVVTVKNEITGKARPNIIHPLSDRVINLTAAVGQDLSMECVFGDLSKLIWTRDNGHIPNTAAITKVGLRLTLAAGDSGQYACKTPDGSKSVIYKLNIQEKPAVESLSPSQVVPTEGSDVTNLKCSKRSDSEIQAWKWYYNGKVISTASGAVFRADEKLGYTTGYYQCFAQNVAGEGYATFHFKNPENSDVEITTSEAYFELPPDPDEVPMPRIELSRTPTQPTSHTLHWSMTGSDVKLFSVKYYKEPVVDENGKVIHYPHKVINVPGDRREVVLTGLDPSSFYTVEMVAVSNAKTISEMAISSFGTGKDESLTILTTDKPVEKDKSGDGQVPRAPSRPDVTGISTKQVSLMWSPRGNGGSPIIGYKIQMKELDGGMGWETVGESKTPPASVGNLERGKTYKFRIIARNAAGDSKPSSTSKPYPKRVKQKRLVIPPFIIKASPQGGSSISIIWEYEGIPLSSISGYYVYFRPTDNDNEDDYTKKIFENPSATSYIIHGMIPEMQYDVKIAAFNDLGRSPFSNVMILEMPKVGGNGEPVTARLNPTLTDTDPDEADRNDLARERANERNTKFLITGAVIGAVLIVLLITVFCYWRKKGAQNAQSTPEMKQKNGNAGGYTQGKPYDHINMSKIDSNGQATPGTPTGSNSPGNHYSHSPHDTRCHCSRHHSNHSSLGRNADYSPYHMPPGPGYPGWGSNNYPNIHSNPMHLYMDPRHAYFPPHGIGRFVRGNGEFCHIIPVDTRKMNAEGGPEVVGHYLLPGGQMVTRTYDGNMTTGDDSVHRPDHGYHSNEEGARTGSESQVDKSDDANPDDDDGNSTGGATSGVVTLNEVAMESRPASPDDEEEPPVSSASEPPTSDNTDVSTSDNSQCRTTENCDETSEICDKDDENTPFLNSDDSASKETTET